MTKITKRLSGLALLLVIALSAGAFGAVRTCCPGDCCADICCNTHHSAK